MNSPGQSTGNDFFLSKIETFRKNKKKSKKEVEDLAAEGRKAMESALCSLEIEDPEHYMLEEGQERSIIERASMESVPVTNLINSLISWINDELVGYRILVRNIADDFYDGQILQNLAEKLAGIKLEHPEVTQSEFGQMQRLKEVITTINQMLDVSETWANQRWSPEMIHSKNVIAILRLLVALARHFKACIRLVDDVALTVIVVRKINGILEYRYEREFITECSQTVVDGQNQPHPLDYLPNRHLVPRLLTRFVNEHLKKLQMPVSDIINDFSDGVRLILLMGLLEGYFVPLNFYHQNPLTDAERMANVQLGFSLISSSSQLPSEPLERPEDIALGDGKAILRLLYGIYTHYHESTGAGGLSSDLQEISEQEEHGNKGTPKMHLEPHQTQRSGGITECIYSN